MRAVVLAGGLGTRLRPYTTIIPKPLVPVGDRPILEHIFQRLALAGVDRVDLCVSHLGGLLEAYFSRSDGVPRQMELAWHFENEPLGTAGALATIPDLDETFIAMNGDILTDLDYRSLVAFHRESGAVLTIASQQKAVDIDLGVIRTDGKRVIGYEEKPTLNYDVSMGIYVYEPEALKHLPSGTCQFPDLVLRLLDAGQHVALFHSDAAWYDIGTPSEYERAIADTSLFAPPPPATP
jgi:NDP-sugar pyrophosphorylase family protein